MIKRYHHQEHPNGRKRMSHFGNSPLRPRMAAEPTPLLDRSVSTSKLWLLAVRGHHRQSHSMAERLENSHTDTPRAKTSVTLCTYISKLPHGQGRGRLLSPLDILAILLIVSQAQCQLHCHSHRPRQSAPHRSTRHHPCTPSRRTYKAAFPQS